MWDIPGPGGEPMSPALAVDSSRLHHQGGQALCVLRGGGCSAMYLSSQRAGVEPSRRRQCFRRSCVVQEGEYGGLE